MVVALNVQVIYTNSGKDMIRNTTVVLKGRTDPNVRSQQYRRAALDLWFQLPEQLSVEAGRRRLIVEHYLNGDWSKKDFIEHYCPATCCATAHIARNMMVKLLPKALLPYTSTQLAQHRWTRLPL